MKFYIAYPLLASLSKAMELTQTGLILQQYGSDLLNSIMNSVGYTQQDSEAITSHGCWCGKLDIKNHPYPELLGGNQPIDELDEICKDWFMCRHCNDKLVGGSCNDVENGIMDREYLLSGEYTMAINQTFPENSVCVEASDTCASDTCVVDLYYANKILEYYDSNSFNSTLVDSAYTCSLSSYNHEDKKCEGTVPYLKIVKIELTAEEQAEQQAEAEQADLLADGWATVDTSGNNNNENESEDNTGVIPVAPSCESTGPSTTRVVFKLFYESGNWYNARDKCNALGNGASLAAIFSAEEAALVHALGASTTAWIGGHDSNVEGQWEWLVGRDGVNPESICYDGWSGGEPNQYGNEDCTEKYTNGKWNDIACTNNRGAYICQIRW